MKNIFKYIAILLVITSCESNLNQVPPLEAASSSLTTYTEVLNAAYHYQQASTTPLAVTTVYPQVWLLDKGDKNCDICDIMNRYNDLRLKKRVGTSEWHRTNAKYSDSQYGSK